MKLVMTPYQIDRVIETNALLAYCTNFDLLLPGKPQVLAGNNRPERLAAHQPELLGLHH
jgi:hypothetical protein